MKAALPVIALLLIAAAPVRDFSVKQSTRHYSYTYGWPKEAVAIPALNRKLTAEMNEDRRWLVKEATSASKQGSWFPPDGYESQLTWETVGQSKRLLSLSGSYWTYTGGAHGNGVTKAMLWDRQRNREIGIAQLLRTGTSWIGAIRQPFCVLLDRERVERRAEPVRRNEMFGDCPSYGSLIVVLTDKDRSGRFDHIDVTADQYVAGPYSEGPYDISLPITGKMIERLKPEYSSSFEPQPPVQ